MSFEIPRQTVKAPKKMTDPNDKAYPFEGYPSGLTKRELFALEAMKSRLLNSQMFQSHGAQYQQVAVEAVMWADGLIAELNKFKPEIVKNDEEVKNEST